MIPLMVFGIIGGCIGAVLAYPYGLLASVAGYMVGGALCALLPGLLSHRKQKVFAKAAHHEEDLGRRHRGATLQTGTRTPSIDSDAPMKP
jgi:hypothetical protein